MSPTKLVLFVCVENSNRSQMAEAFARMHAGKGVEAASSGSRPSGRVNPRAIEFMREVGYDLTAHTSKSLDQFNGQEVEVAVTMAAATNARWSGPSGGRSGRFQTRRMPR